MADKGFFEQFLMSPSNATSEQKQSIARAINNIHRAYLEIATRHEVDGRFLSFGRPVYLLIALTDRQVYVIYTNENAVRGHTQWWFLDLTGQTSSGDVTQDIVTIARRDIGLSGWKRFRFARILLDQDDHSLTEAAATAIFNHDYQEELTRRRIVRINPIFTGRDFVVKPRTCFVLMPFRDDLDPVYTDHIKVVCDELHIDCQRADDIFRNTAIIEDIWEAINTAHVIVADLTGKNPNVFYEVGVAHTVGKKVILITQSIDHVPFDLRHLRHVQYEYTPRGMDAFEQQLRNTLVTVLDEPAS
jgi:hypothetical protein